MVKEFRPCQFWIDAEERVCGLAKTATVHTLEHAYEAPPKAPAPRTALNHRSVEQQKRLDEARPAKEQRLLDYPYCEPARLGIPGACYGVLTPHHVLPTGRGGDDDYEGLRSVCAHHNTALSQDAETMRWGLANGYLKRNVLA